jgi:hypothetical protein
VIARGKPIRERLGMNVRVGNHIAPELASGIRFGGKPRFSD